MHFFRFKYVNNLQVLEKNIRSLYKNKSKSSLTQFISNSFQQKLHKLKCAVTNNKFEVEDSAQNSTSKLTLAKAFQNDLKVSLVEI